MQRFFSAFLAVLFLAVSSHALQLSLPVSFFPAPIQLDQLSALVTITVDGEALFGEQPATAVQGPVGNPASYRFTFSYDDLYQPYLDNDAEVRMTQCRFQLSCWNHTEEQTWVAQRDYLLDGQSAYPYNGSSLVPFTPCTPNVPQCSLSPASLNFGTCVPDSGAVRSCWITNSGSGILTGTVEENCDAFTILSGADYSLSAGQSQELVVAFQTPQLGSYSCVLSLGAGCSELSCSALCDVPSSCVLSPPALNFGSTALGIPTQLSFTLTNTGGGLLSGSFHETSEEFSLVSGADYSLSAGQSQTVVVQFLATQTGNYNCVLDSGGDCPSLICTGHGYQNLSESFNHGGALPPGWTIESRSTQRTTPWTPVYEGGDDWALRTEQSAFQVPYEEWLISPVYDLSWVTQASLYFYHSYSHNGSQASVRYSTTGGLSWLPLTDFTWSTGGGWGTNISSWADGQSAVRFAFRFSASFPNGGASWTLDDFQLSGATAPPVASAPLPVQPPPVTEGLSAWIGCTWHHAYLVDGSGLEVRVDENGDGWYSGGGVEGWRSLPVQPSALDLTVSTLAAWTVPGTERRFEFRARSANGQYGYSGSRGEEGIQDDWSVTLHQDLVAPTFHSLLPADGSWQPTLTPLVGITVQDDDAGVDPARIELRVDRNRNGSYDWDEPWEAVATSGSGLSIPVEAHPLLPADGEYRMEFRAWDLENNGPAYSPSYEGIWDDFWVRVDATPPTACSLNGWDEGPSTLHLTFNSTYDERFARYEVRCSPDSTVDEQDLLWGPEQDSGLYYPYVGQTWVQNLASDQDWYLRLWAVDVAGNRSPASNLLHVVLHSDHEQPLMTDPLPANQPEPGWQATRTPEVGITVTDSGRGVDAARLAMRIDLNRNGNYDGDEDWQPLAGYENGAQIQILEHPQVPEDGEYRVEFRAWDLIDNGPVHSLSGEGIWDDIRVRVDATPPTACVLYAAAAGARSVTLQFSPTTEERFARYEIRCSADSLVNEQDRLWSAAQDPALGSQGTWQTTVTNLEAGGWWHFQLWAVDVAGNRSPASNLVRKLTQGSPPAAVADLRVSRTPTGLHLAWTPPTQDVFGQTPVVLERYEVHSSTTPWFQPSELTRIASTTVPQLDIPLANPAELRVYYRVVAFGSGPGAPTIPGIVGWGDNGNGQTSPPPPQAGMLPISVSAGAHHGLGLYADGFLVAWGSNDYGQCSIPEPMTSFKALAAGSNHSLGLRMDGSVLAWGYNWAGQCNPPEPNMGYTALAGGESHSLAMHSDGTVVGWGYNDYGQCDPWPNEGFTAIAAGSIHSLGLKTDGSVACWGYNGHGQCNIPGENTGFSAVAGGAYHSLGLKQDGSIVAWGYNDYGQCNVPWPNQDFIAVAAGSYHSMGLKSDGRVVCWGSNWYGEGQAPDPNEQFQAIAAGYSFNLGIRPIPLPLP